MRADGIRTAHRLRIQDDVASVLREAIVSGVFAPGEHLREEDLSERLKVSRGPIRHALSIMEHEGLVHIEPHKGARIPLLARKDVEEVYSLRVSLETLAATWAVEHAGDRDLADMRAVLEGIPAVLERGNLREITDIDLQFHDALCRSAHHDRLYTAWRSLRSQVELFLFSRNTFVTTSREIMVDGHAMILHLLTARAVEALKSALEDHVRSGYERLCEQYP